MMRHVIVWMSLCVLMILMLSAAPLPTALAQDGATATPTPLMPEAILKRAEEALQRADEIAQASDRALETVSRMLSFLETVGAIFGFILALATTVGVGFFFYIQRRANKALNEAEQLRNQAETTLSDIRSQGELAARAAMLLQVGAQQIRAHNNNAAFQALSEAHKIDPNNPAVNYYLGELYSERRDLDRAVELLQASAKDFPPAEAALGFALSLKARDEQDSNKRNRLYAQAEQHFLSALERDPEARDINGASFYGVLGGMYRRQGRLDDAIRAYSQAAKVTPHSSYPLNNLAMLYLMQEKHNEAQETFKRSKTIASRAVDGDPFDYWARFDLITAHVALGEYSDAQKQLDFLLDSPPQSNVLKSFMSGLEFIQQAVRDEAKRAQIGQITARVQALIAKQEQAEQASA
ncbi:MAG: hypothetical protein CUN49_08915 [Candidatus Thermofonsia Clade 1 bacterium]|uniref:Uncharacterized protein n=1 Tax=Candidatus Thermofonsia Clade 1 bacterium TaxID=2364210 RepID=A0A2M8PDX9_9CHLR|nr:MAG: hypothetical protein CUN49_08915 [Candidatus Thermofonsia Clade 1 bacterium]